MMGGMERAIIAEVVPVYPPIVYCYFILFLLLLLFPPVNIPFPLPIQFNFIRLI